MFRGPKNPGGKMSFNSDVGDNTQSWLGLDHRTSSTETLQDTILENESSSKKKVGPQKNKG